MHFCRMSQDVEQLMCRIAQSTGQMSVSLSGYMHIRVGIIVGTGMSRQLYIPHLYSALYASRSDIVYKNGSTSCLFCLFDGV